ncbi:hypothetical protein KIW84_044233 [Lathyrus oleraceus]|uniref:Uncharacterized protein n=1 Tax=Pisum sativum TaxID=3888 RepID=A0A9D5AV63_PEA|nr:hypothetical protein KIW84_044233 [Pisum sativum]
MSCTFQFMPPSWFVSMPLFQWYRWSEYVRKWIRIASCAELLFQTCVVPPLTLHLTFHLTLLLRVTGRVTVVNWDLIARRSLGYGYVNYNNPPDAARDVRQKLGW